MKKEPEAIPQDNAQQASGVSTADAIMPQAPITQDAPVDADQDIEALKAELEELRQYKETMEKDNQLIMDVLDAEPRLAKIFQDLSMGATLREALARHFDPDDLVAQEGDPDFEAWEKNRNARIQEMKTRRETDEKIAANQKMTMAEIRAFAEENNMDKEQAIEFLGKLDELFTNVYSGLIDRKTLTFLKKAIDADQMVNEAREEGEIAGRNTRIKETIAPVKSGDGLPKIAATENTISPAPVKKKGYIESLMERGA